MKHALFAETILDGFQLGHFNKEICCSHFCCLHFQPVLFFITKDGREGDRLTDTAVPALQKQHKLKLKKDGLVKKT